MYQSEVHDGLSHEFAQKAELHLDLGDVSRLGGAAKWHRKQASGAEHVLGALLAPWRDREIGTEKDIIFIFIIYIYTVYLNVSVRVIVSVSVRVSLSESLARQCEQLPP